MDVRNNYLIDVSKLRVIIRGGTVNPTDTLVYSASVPKLVVHQGRVYLYWSSIGMDRVAPRTWRFLLTRGVEIFPVSDGRNFVVGASKRDVVMANDPETSIVLDRINNPRNDVLADVFDVRSTGSHIIVTAALGGGACVAPLDQTSSGCYRLALFAVSNPLGNFRSGHIAVAQDLRHEYARFIQYNGNVYLIFKLIQMSSNSHTSEMRAYLMTRETLSPVCSLAKSGRGYEVLNDVCVAPCRNTITSSTCSPGQVSMGKTFNANTCCRYAPSPAVYTRQFDLFRMYVVFFNSVHRNGFGDLRMSASRTDLLNNFINVSPFLKAHISKSNSEFVEAAFRNVLGRGPGTATSTYVQALNDGSLSRGNMLWNLADSPEGRLAMESKFGAWCVICSLFFLSLTFV